MILVAKFEKNDLLVTVHQTEAYEFTVTRIDTYAREVIGRHFCTNYRAAVKYAKECISV